ncbi:uncharacterized protein [Palaemon carinicauda]|uniref:uncharacterized protein n=1 Tax=Palaemon carinicauda TaxID=392227 RepID=UPI0035B5D38E
MDYSGPASVSEVENDLHLTDAEDVDMIHWPPLTHSLPHKPSSTVANTPMKRPVDYGSDISSAPQSPAAKTSKCQESFTRQKSDVTLPHPPTRHASSATPAFAPRDEYARLVFKENLSTDTKLRWLTEVNKTFNLDKELTEVKMSAITSKFVYIARSREDIIGRVKGGEFLSISLDIQDSIDRPRKYLTYLITRYPIEADPNLAKEMPGEYSARRFLQNGNPINRIVITWSLLEPPPSVYEFSFLPCLPPCELRRMKDDQPNCFNCWGIGHISRYCSASPKCAWCAAAHSTRTCPYRKPVTDASTSLSESSSTPKTVHWKCPRWGEAGVNVWHGCSRRSLAATQSLPLTAPPPPPPQPVSTVSLNPPESAEISKLRTAVAALESHCTVLSTRFDAIDARFDSLIVQQATTASNLDTLVKTQQVLITSVASLTEKLDTVASCLERVSGLLPTQPPPLGAPSNSATSPVHARPVSCSVKGKLR